MKRLLRLVFLSAVVTITSSCNIDDVITTSLPPNIILDNDAGIYTVKQSREIVITPNYESAEGAEYYWTMNGEVLSTSPSLRFMQDKTGEYFITICVITESGSDKEEIRIDVIDLEVPIVSIASSKHQTTTVGATLDFFATVRESTLATQLIWSLNGEKICEGLSCTFKATTVGVYTITATASNEDGTHSDSIIVEVLNVDEMPFLWEFTGDEYHTVVGRKLLIAPHTTIQDDSVTYCWNIAGNDEPIGHDSHLIFLSEAAGEYKIIATATIEKKDEKVTLTREFNITIYEEGLFYRAKSVDSKADWNKVYEYTPAPGQFINELKTGGFNETHTTPEAAIAYAEARMSQTNENGEPNPIWISLGGFGGYIIVGFDHSIDNSGDYDFAILGNSFDGSSEPGIVWVMQDENGDGTPNDTWYELAGSETGKAETIQNYAVTYYRPSGPKMPVQWKDNQGNSGEIDYLKQFHTQDSYYPLWVKEDSYTLTGTCLKANNYDVSGNGTYWVNPHYEWGYADNWSPIDRLTDNDNANANANANHFKISSAIDFECQSIDLRFIDFIKVQVGVNTKSGWLGEVSTEVFGFYDYNMKK